MKAQKPTKDSTADRCEQNARQTQNERQNKNDKCQKMTNAN
jgi:hypothetical protein